MRAHRSFWSQYLLPALLLALVLSSSLSAQTFRGSILGTITDSTQAAIPAASVTVKNVATGLTRSTESDNAGNFLIPELPIGTYELTVQKPGFQTAVVRDLKVEVAGERRVDVTLQAGALEQRVEVGASVPLVETTSNVLGGTFESTAVLDLPINGRDYTKLLIMVPGAAGEPNGGGDSPGSFGLFSVNGNRGRANNFLLDGTDMNDGYRNLPAINQGGVFGTPGTILPVESLAEVRILSNFEPEYGRNSGAVVNIVTKSGTNEIHGSIFEYFRNDKLNARNFFNSVGPKDKFRNNQFGAAIGGPLVKDKTFWYFNYEGQRESLGVASVNTVPGPADFAAAITSLGGDPTIPIASNPVVNPVIQNLFRLCANKGGCSGGHNVWPSPNIAGAAPGSPNSVASAPAANDVDSLIAKIDHSFNERNQVSGRYFFGNSQQSFPLGLAGGNNLPNTNTFSPIRTQLLSLSYVRVLSSRQVNEARFGWNRYKQDFLPADRGTFGNPNDTLQLNTGVTNPRDFGLPTIRFGTFASLGSSPFSNPRGRVDSNFQFIDNFSWKLTRHEVKFGYEFRRTAVDSFNNFNFRGVLVFNTLADFLAGTPTNTAVFGSHIIAGNTDREARQNSHAVYLQDSFRWTNRFTVNLGLRWDYFGVIHEAHDLFSIYDPARGLVHRDPLYDPDYNNFSPRVSFAWDVRGKGKTVIRGGFGVFYDIFSQDAFTGQIFFNSFNAGLAYNPIAPDSVFFSNARTSLIVPGAPVFDPTTLQPGTPTTTDAATVNNIRTPYIYNYNLNLEQELFRNTVLQIGYVGSGGRKLFRFRDINQPSLATIQATASPGCCVSRPFDTAAVLSPVAPNQPFYVNQLETSANSNYNSLQVSLAQRSWHGLTQQIAWTWSHSIDTASDSQDFVPNAAQPNDSTNVRAERGNSNFDTRHRFVWSVDYEFPKWKALGWMGEGWQFSNVLTLMSGHPFQLNYNFIDDYSGSGEFFDRPDVVARPTYNPGNPLQYLDLSAFQVPCTLNPAGSGFASDCLPFTRHFGTLGRNSLIGPDYRNFDLAIIKVTRLSERFKLLFRADFYNLTNHPNFANPLMPAFFADAAPNRSNAFPLGLNPATGRSVGFYPITATSDTGLGNPILGGGGPRSVQFALKLIF